MKKNEPLKTDYSNKFNRHIWLSDRRRDLIHYFESRNRIHGSIDATPHWSVIPRTSIWKIPSQANSGTDGWYGIAGDHPTDTAPMHQFDGDPRKILDHFVNKWLHASERLKNGEDFGDFRIRNADQRPSIGDLIEDRAKRIQLWVQSEELWLTPHNPSYEQLPVAIPEDEKQIE